MIALSTPIEAAIASPECSPKTRKLAPDRVLYHLDRLNRGYFQALFAKYQQGGGQEPLVIFESGKDLSERAVAYPTAIAPADLLKALSIADYAALTRSPENAAAARNAVLWVKKMQAGTGSSMTRTKYLAEALGIPESEVRIGAKGTDLFVEVPDPVHAGKKVRISLAEAQLLQMVVDARQGRFGGIVFHDIISRETKESVEQLWNKPSLLDPKKTYRQLVEAEGLLHFGTSFQDFIPTVDTEGNLTTNRTAPGGHGLFGVDALRAAFVPGGLPKTDGKPLVAVVGNGEDLSSTPDAHMVGWMVNNRVPIVMVATEKTPGDKKGGQIALVRGADGGIYATIIEQSQAKEAGQLPLFEEIGITKRNGEQVACFNTNMALFNYEVLAPKLGALVKEIGEEAFLKIVAPDLIQNWKEQKDADGVVRKYLQLEGAMGSSLLNLDRYWRNRYHEPLVHVINVGREHRTDFFSPIKSAFDYFLQFHSDRFEFDGTTMRLRNLRPESLPSITLADAPSKDKYYQDVSNVLASFAKVSTVGLDTLSVQGQVTMKDAILRGKVTIVNPTGAMVDLVPRLLQASQVPKVNGRPVLENVKVEVQADGSLSIQAVP